MIGLIIAAVVIAYILLIIFLPAVALGILGFLLIVILLLLLIPIGADVKFIDGKFSLAAKISFYSYRLFPKEKKAETSNGEKKSKKEKIKKEKTEDGKKPSKKLSLSFDEILQIAKRTVLSLSKFGKLTVHKFVLHYIAAGKDPYSTAMSYNYVNAALSGLAPCCSKAFRVKGDVDVWTDIDFTMDKMRIDAELSITLRLIQLVHVALYAGFGILGVLIKHKIRSFREKRAAKKKNISLPQANNTEENK